MGQGLVVGEARWVTFAQQTPKKPRIDAKWSSITLVYVLSLLIAS